MERERRYFGGGEKILTSDSGILIDYTLLPATVKCLNCGQDNLRTNDVCSKCGADLYKSKIVVLPKGYEPPGSPARDRIQVPMEHDISRRAKILFYLVSFFVPIVGIVLGAIFYVRYPDPYGRFREAGRNCLILAIISVVLSLIVVIVLLAASVLTLSRSGA